MVSRDQSVLPSPGATPSSQSQLSETTSCPDATQSAKELREELEKKLNKLQRDTVAAEQNVSTAKENLAEAQSGFLNSRVTLLSGHQTALTEQLGNDQLYLKNLKAQTRGYSKALELLTQVEKNADPELAAQLNKQLEKFPLADQSKYRQYIADLQTNNQTLSAVDETYRKQEVVVRTTRNVAIAAGAAIATGGVLSGAYLATTTASMGTVGTTAVALGTGTALGTTAGLIGNSVEAVGHVALENKTTGQAVGDAFTQTVSDARTSASGALNAVGGMAAARAVGTIAGTVGATTTNAVIQAAVNNVAVIKVLSGAAAGSAGALTSGIANTALDVSSGARPLDISAIGKDLAFDAIVGALAGGLGGGAGALKEGKSALTFATTTGVEMAGDLAIGYGSAAARAKLEGRELTFDEVTQEVAGSVLGTTIGEMGGQHGAKVAETIRAAHDTTSQTTQPPDPTLNTLELPIVKDSESAKTQIDTFKQEGEVTSSNNKVRYVDSAEKVTTAYRDARAKELQAQGIEANEALAQATNDAKGVHAFYDAEKNQVVTVMPGTRLHSGTDRTQKIIDASILVHEMAHLKASEASAQNGELSPIQKTENEIAAYEAQAAYLRKNGFTMEFHENGWTVLPLTTKSDESPTKAAADNIESFVRKTYRDDHSQQLAAIRQQKELAALASQQVEQKEALFAQIRDLSTTSTQRADETRTEQIALIGRIFEHSVADGLELIKVFPLTPGELANIIGSEGFRQKHSTLLTALAQTISPLRTNSLANSLLIHIEAPELGNHSENLASNTALGNQINKDIDKYYAQFLRTKEFRAIEQPPETLSKGERLAENSISTARGEINGIYYTDTAKNILRPELIATGLTPQEADSRLEAMASYFELARIESNRLFEFCDNNGLDLEKITPKLEKARHSSMLYPLEKQVAEKELIRELNQALATRGGRVTLNSQSDTYEIVFDREPTLQKAPTLVSKTLLALGNNEQIYNLYQTNDGPFLITGTEHPSTRVLKDKDLQDHSYGSTVVDVQMMKGRVFQKIPGGVILDHNGTMIAKNQMSIGALKIIDGTAYFIESHNGKEYLHDEKGNQYGKGYDKILTFGGFDGKLTLTTTDESGGYAIVDAKSGDTIESFPKGSWPGMEIGFPATPIKAGDTTYIPIIGGKNLVRGFMARNMFLSLPEDKYFNYSVCNDELYFLVKHQGEHYFSSVGGHNIGRQDADFISESSTLIAAGDQLYFTARDSSGDFVINENGERFFFEYRDAKDFTVIGDKIYALVYDDSNHTRFVACTDGRTFGKDALITSSSHIALNSSGISYIESSNDGLTTLVTVDPREITVEATAKADEERKLQLLNIVHTPTAENIDFYYAHMADDPTRNEVERRDLASSNTFAKTITAAMHAGPEAFLDAISIPAKRDQSPTALAQRLAEKLLPELQWNKQEQPSFFSRVRSLLDFGRNQNRNQPTADPSTYLKPRQFDAMRGAGNFDDTRKVMEFRDNETAFISSGLFGAYNKNNANWEKYYFPASTKLSDPVKETTYTLSDIGKLSSITLPKPLDATIILDRVHGIDSNGKEIMLETEINSLGEVIAHTTHNQKITKVIYSIRKSEIPTAMKELSQNEYDIFRAQFEKAHGKSMTVPIATLPEEAKLFLEQIKTLQPKEQILAIEQYGRTIGFYDFDNGEINQSKDGKSIDEQLHIMQQRVNDLATNKPELAPRISGKQFAGVCADFANLEAAMLRSAGFISGVTSGFLPTEKTATIADAHAVAFVVWPDEKGDLKIVTVDGTPPENNGQQQNIVTPSILEREEAAANQQEAIVNQQQEEVAELIKAVEDLDIEKLRLLENGKLESVVNTMLQTMVKEPQLEALRGVIDYYWYTPLHKLDLGNPRNQTQLATAFADEQQRLRGRIPPSDISAGNALFQMIDDFATRFESSGLITTRNAALKTLEQIIDIAQPSLDPIEAKTAYAVINYLRANVMAAK